MYACNVKLPIVHSMYLSFHKLIIGLFLALLSLVSILCFQFIFNTENNQKKRLGNGNCCTVIFKELISLQCWSEKVE